MGDYCIHNIKEKKYLKRTSLTANANSRKKSLFSSDFLGGQADLESETTVD